MSVQSKRYARNERHSDIGTLPSQKLTTLKPNQNPGIGVSNSTIVMTPCDGTANSSTWCCGSSSSCCGTSKAISIAQLLGTGLPKTVATSSTSSTMQTTMSTITVATAPTIPQPLVSTSSFPSSPSTNLSSGVKVGIGLGVSVGFIGLVTLISGAFILGKRRASRDNMQGGFITDITNRCHKAKVHEKPHDPIIHGGELPAVPLNQRLERYELSS